MRYWPLSVIRTSPLLPGDCAAELDSFCEKRKLSPRACGACEFVIRKTRAVRSDNLVMARSNVVKFIYLARPTQEQWNRLERISFVTDPDGSIFITVEPLH